MAYLNFASLSFFNNLKLSWSAMKNSKIMSTIAFFSISIVICLTIIFKTIIDLSPQIMIKLSQTDSGTIDYFITPKYQFFTQRNVFFNLQTLKKDFPMQKFSERDQQIIEIQYSGKQFDNIRLIYMNITRQQTFHNKQSQFPKQLIQGQCILHQQLSRMMDLSQGDQLYYKKNQKCVIVKIIQKGWPLLNNSNNILISGNQHSFFNTIVFQNDSIYKQTYKQTILEAKTIQQKFLYKYKSIHINFPVVNSYRIYDFFALFLNILFNFLIVIFTFICIIMIYNVLISSVQTKIFQGSILRTLGSGAWGMAKLILTQALLYIIVGMIIGFILSLLGLYLVKQILFQLLKVQINNMPSGSSIGFSFLLGIIIPIVSSIFPIYNALKYQLVDGLRPDKNNLKSVIIQFQSKKNRIPIQQISFGILAVILGTFVYYFLPYTILIGDFQLLFWIFTGLLISLLLSLALLAFNFQGFAQKFVAYIILFWIGSINRSLLIKNLIVHRIKNKKTALFYSIAVSVLIYMQVGLDIQLQNLGNQQRYQSGSFFSMIQRRNGFNIAQLKPVLQKSQLKSLVQSYSLVTFPLSNTVQKYYLAKQFYITNVGQNIKKAIYQFKGVSYNYLNSIDTGSKFQVQPNTKLTASQYLYTPEGYLSAITSQDSKHKLDISSEGTQFYLFYSNNSFARKIKLKCSYISSFLPGIRLRIGGINDFVVSIPTFLNISQRKHNQNLYQKYLIFKRVVFKLYDENKYQQLLQLLKQNLNINKNIDFYVTTENQKQMKDVTDLLDIVINILIVVVLILSFFNLITSVTGNVFDHRRQIAIMRGLGVTKIKIFFIFALQSFTLILSSCLLGIIIGTIVAYTMLLQMKVFMGVQSAFYFPWQLTLIILCAAIILAVLSPISSLVPILRKQINLIFRNS